jgi:hypothetical protein
MVLGIELMTSCLPGKYPTTYFICTPILSARSLFFRRGLVLTLPKLASDHDPSTSTSQVAGIIDVYQTPSLKIFSKRKRRKSYLVLFDLHFFGSYWFLGSHVSSLMCPHVWVLFSCNLANSQIRGLVFSYWSVQLYLSSLFFHCL